MVINEEKPTSDQPVQEGGFQPRPKSASLHDFTMGE
jgi:hypothetical protein